MIKAVLMNQMPIPEHISHPAESAALIQLGECCSVNCQQLLPVCVCPCCKGVGCEMIDNGWHKSWHLCVDRWPSGCTGWQWGYGTAVQGVLLGSTACQCDVFPYGCLILSVFYWTRAAHSTHIGKLAVSFLKSVTELNLWGSFLFLTLGLCLSRSDAVISAFSHSLQFLHLGRFKPSLLGW